MTTTQVCIDCYNSNVSAALGDLRHVFSSYDRFVELTGFERGNVNNATYELERNLFAVEYVGGVVVLGNQTPEIQWIENNIENIRQAAVTDKATFRLDEISMRQNRTGLLYNTDWLIVRHNEQLLLGADPTLTPQQLQELGVYRQALRDMPDEILAGTTYTESEWPTVPSFLS